MVAKYESLVQSIDATKNKFLGFFGLGGELVKDITKFSFMEKFEIAFNVTFFNVNYNTN